MYQVHTALVYQVSTTGTRYASIQYPVPGISERPAVSLLVIPDTCGVRYLLGSWIFVFGSCNQRVSITIKEILSTGDIPANKSHNAARSARAPPTANRTTPGQPGAERRGHPTACIDAGLNVYLRRQARYGLRDGFWKQHGGRQGELRTCSIRRED